MTAAALLNDIFRTKTVHDANGKTYQLDHNVDTEEGKFLTGLIKKYQPKRTIEIGCAYGISSLFICSALESVEGAHHTIIDPGQSKYYQNIGIDNLKKANINFFEFFEELSELKLPELLKSGQKYDLGFIDGDHRFEYTLLDFFYLNRMIDVGGIIVIDDTGIPAVNKMMRYVLNYPAYKIVDRVPLQNTSARKTFDTIVKRPASFLTKLFPEKLKYEFFSPALIKSEQSLQLNSAMIALQKVANDDRNWDWFKDF